MAAAVNVELSEATSAVYLEHLASIEDEVLTKAIDAVIQRWTEPSKMPPVAEILNTANQLKLTIHLEGYQAGYRRLKVRYDQAYAEAEKNGKRWISD